MEIRTGASAWTAAQLPRHQGFWLSRGVLQAEEAEVDRVALRLPVVRMEPLLGTPLSI